MTKRGAILTKAHVEEVEAKGMSDTLLWATFPLSDEWHCCYSGLSLELNVYGYRHNLSELGERVLVCVRCYIYTLFNVIPSHRVLANACAQAQSYQLPCLGCLETVTLLNVLAFSKEITVRTLEQDFLAY